MTEIYASHIRYASWKASVENHMRVLALRWNFYLSSPQTVNKLHPHIKRHTVLNLPRINRRTLLPLTMWGHAHRTPQIRQQANSPRKMAFVRKPVFDVVPVAPISCKWQCANRAIKRGQYHTSYGARRRRLWLRRLKDKFAIPMR